MSEPCTLCAGTDVRPFIRRPEMTVLRCSCGFAFAARDTPVEPYDAVYFDKWGSAGDALIGMKKRTYRSVLSRAPGPKGRKLLDVGCALGWSLDAAGEDGFLTAGVEVSGHAAESAGRRHDVRLSTGEFEDGSFDLVTLVDVIEHVRDPVGLLRETRRLLRPGGCAVLTTPDLSSLSARTMGFRWPYIIPEHVVYFDRSTIRMALRRAGLEPARVGPIRKSLRADYVASVLASRGDTLGRVGSAFANFFGGTEVGLCSGDLCAAARPSAG